MKRIILFSLFNLMCHNCASQNMTTNETFDKALLKGQKIMILKVEPDIIKEIGETENAYYQITSRNNDPYISIKTFSKDDGKIKSITNKFYYILVGEYKRYDTIGKLQQDIDIDYHVTFTIKDLIEKMDHEYHINLLDKKGKNVNFDNKTDKFYIVTIGVDHQRIRIIKVSADNGNVISDTMTGFVK